MSYKSKLGNTFISIKVLREIFKSSNILNFYTRRLEKLVNYKVIIYLLIQQDHTKKHHDYILKSRLFIMNEIK